MRECPRWRVGFYLSYTTRHSSSKHTILTSTSTVNSKFTASERNTSFVQRASPILHQRANATTPTQTATGLRNAIEHRNHVKPILHQYGSPKSLLRGPY